MSEAAIAASANPAQVVQLARAALNAVTAPQTTASARATRRRIVAAFQRGFGQGLPIDGDYGPRTSAAISVILDIPTEDLPGWANDGDAPPTPSPRSRPAVATEPPARLTTALQLAQFSASAVSQDTTAARVLASLNTNAGVQAVRAAESASTTRGDLGRVPDPPTSESVLERARAAWERARASGASAARTLDQRARAAVAEGERALRQVRAALDRETDIAVRQALAAVEAGLTAILRPLSRGIATAVRPVAGPALLIGAGLLLFMLSSRK